MVPGTRPHSHSKRRAAPDSSPALSVPHGVARGVLVTPWFAAASGFVIAVSMWVLWPHADLHILAGGATANLPYNGGGNGEDNGATKDHHTGSTASPLHSDARGADRRDRASGQADGTKAAGAAVRYYVVANSHGFFDIVITVPGRHARTHWDLGFLLRGDENIRVYGADWQASGQGGIASELTPGAEPGRGQQPFENPVPGRHRREVSFEVSGAGPNIRPTACVLNGKTCHFTEVKS